MLSSNDIYIDISLLDIMLLGGFDNSIWGYYIYFHHSLSELQISSQFNASTHFRAPTAVASKVSGKTFVGVSMVVTSTNWLKFECTGIIVGITFQWWNNANKV
jgi:hypothetical protein